MPRKCVQEGCEKVPAYNDPGETVRKYCRAHAKPGMIPAGYKRCQSDGCGKYALFNYATETEKLYCQTHAKPGMINLKKKTCAYKDCLVQPYYNHPGKKVGLYCQEHAKKGMINVFVAKCTHDGCTTVASFNLPDQDIAMYCKEHASPEMINVRSKVCEAPGCNKQPSFNHPGEVDPKFCNDHKEEGMVNVRANRCKYTGCRKVPTFGYPNGNKAEYCKEHALPEMTNVLKTTCAFPDCEIVPCYNFPDQKKGLYCKEHAKDGMRNVVSKTCSVEGCQKIASYAFSGQKTKRFCAAHKKPDMINLSHAYCTAECSKFATYGFPGLSPSSCAQHKQAGMILQPRKKCINRNCQEIAVYGTNTQNHCEKHKKEDEINLIERECKSCHLLGVLDTEGICKFCNPEAFKYVRLAKQKEVQAFLDRKKFDYISTDCIVENGICGKERPDFLFETPTHFIVLEVDEHQHRERACECEQARMVNISQSLGMTTIFLRYNPDEYTFNRRKHNPSKVTRNKTLEKWLRHLLELSVEDLQEYGFLSAMYLFFDGYKASTVEPELIMQNELDLPK